MESRYHHWPVFAMLPGFHAACSLTRLTCFTSTAGRQITFLDCASGRVLKRYHYPNEEFCALAWTVFNGNVVVAAGGQVCLLENGGVGWARGARGGGGDKVGVCLCLQPRTPLCLQPRTPLLLQPRAPFCLEPRAPLCLQPRAPLCLQPRTPLSLQPHTHTFVPSTTRTLVPSTTRALVTLVVVAGRGRDVDSLRPECVPRIARVAARRRGGA